MESGERVAFPLMNWASTLCSHTICTASQAMAAHLLHPHHSRLSEQVQDFMEAAERENARFYLIIS